MRTSTLVALALAATGCASSPTVRDEDLARANAPRTGQLKDARQELGAAEEELARAQARISEARKEEEASEEERDAAEEELEKARKAAEAAGARFRAAEARAEHCGRLIEAREADAAAAKRHVELARAKGELARFQALEQTKAPVLAEYDTGAFYERVAETQREFEGSRKKALEADRKAKEAQRDWEELARQVPAK